MEKKLIKEKFYGSWNKKMEDAPKDEGVILVTLQDKTFELVLWNFTSKKWMPARAIYSYQDIIPIAWKRILPYK